MSAINPAGIKHKDQPVSVGWSRLVGWCALASGSVSIFGIAFLILFFVGLGFFGTLNDIMVAVQYTLMLPIALWIGRRQKRPGESRSQLVMLVGFAGMLSVIALQAMLVLGMIPFSQQIGPVSGAFLVVLGWFLITGRTAREDALLDSNVLLLIGAGLYVGYPFWAIRLARRLLYI
ncbi:MAG: hypothetical protein WBR18_14550 [Anaerolineales bacterium]